MQVLQIQAAWQLCSRGPRTVRTDGHGTLRERVRGKMRVQIFNLTWTQESLPVGMPHAAPRGILADAQGSDDGSESILLTPTR
jgi:hypothetical protein